ncbi:hypothetical protein [Paraburkholderia pallida]|uniref:hypothetical protein n=1 Tax=Paraburkholderia pallida TaxID=2547399 RepID=UPI001E3A1F88|nr:hypothetical protein [Paraburkholderia pallida]
MGVYDNCADARSAQQALRDAGMVQADVAVYSMSVEAPAEKGPRVYAIGGGDVRDRKVIFDELEHLFARIFKNSEYPPETEDYREFVRRGGTLVCADVSDREVDVAIELMRRAGATDIEERANAWRNASTKTGMPEHVARRASLADRDAPGHYEPQRAAPTGGSSAAGSTGMQSARYALDEPKAAGVFQQVTTRTQRRGSPGTGLVGDPVMGTPLDDDDLYDSEFRKDYDAHYANTGVSYDEYRRADAHGATFGQDERYRGYDWQQVEPSARKDWESRYPASGWERFKAAVHHGWERVIGR